MPVIESMPVVEYGFPIPPEYPPATDGRRQVEVSPWVKYLQGLPIGASFRVSWSTSYTVAKYARQLGIKLRVAPTNCINQRGLAERRIWRIA